MFSIVIVNWNGEKHINSLLNSLLCQTYKGFKLYFVDNGSTDASISFLEKFKYKLDIELIKLNTNTGFAKGNNKGLAEAFKDEYEYVFTLNNDIELKPDCLMKLKEFIKKNKEFQVFQPLMLNYYNRETIDACGIRFTEIYFAELMGYGRSIFELNNYSVEIDGVCAGAAVYLKSALSQVKIYHNEFFNSNFFAYYEDVDLAMRLKKAGFRSALVKDSQVYHVHSATTGIDSEFKAYYATRNMLLYLYNNLERKQFRKYMLKYYYTVMLVVLKDLKMHNYKNAFSRVKGLVNYFKIR